MAVTFDNGASLSHSVVGQTMTNAFTIGGGANRLLLVGVSFMKTTVGGGAVSGLTYNGVSLTKFLSSEGSAATHYRYELWVLLESSMPAAGAHNLIVTFSGTPVALGFAALSFSAVDQNVWYNSGQSNSGDVTGPLSTISVNYTAFAPDLFGFTMGMYSDTHASAGVNTPTVFTTQGYSGAMEIPITGGAQQAGYYQFSSYGTCSAGAIAPQWTVVNGGSTASWFMVSLNIRGLENPTPHPGDPWRQFYTAQDILDLLV